MLITTAILDAVVQSLFKDRISIGWIFWDTGRGGGYFERLLPGDAGGEEGADDDDDGGNEALGGHKRDLDAGAGVGQIKYIAWVKRKDFRNLWLT